MLASSPIPANRPTGPIAAKGKLATQASAIRKANRARTARCFSAIRVETLAGLFPTQSKATLETKALRLRLHAIDHVSLVGIKCLTNANAAGGASLSVWRNAKTHQQATLRTRPVRQSATLAATVARLSCAGSNPATLNHLQAATCLDNGRGARGGATQANRHTSSATRCKRVSGTYSICTTVGTGGAAFATAAKEVMLKTSQQIPRVPYTAKSRGGCALYDQPNKN